MAEDTEQSSKTEEPTQKRLDDARKQGDVPKSAELVTFASLAAVTGVTAVGGGGFCRSIAEQLVPFLSHPDAFDLADGGGQAVLKTALNAATPAFVVLACAAVAGVAFTVLQQGMVWSPSKLAPDPSKLSPMQGLKRLFGLDSLVNFAKSLVKLLVVGAIGWMVVGPRLTTLVGLAAFEPAALLPYSKEVLIPLCVAVLIATGALAGFDWFWTRLRFLQRMRMTREETKEEHKQSDGDPHIKARLRHLRHERARKRMIQAVPTATVVVMNPTHYAVALRYVQGETPAPMCVAKGVDSIALKIREIAEAHGVAVVEDPPLARALHSAVEVDRSIPREHYEAVARLIGGILAAARARSRPARRR